MLRGTETIIIGSGRGYKKLMTGMLRGTETVTKASEKEDKRQGKS